MHTSEDPSTRDPIASSTGPARAGDDASTAADASTGAQLMAADDAMSALERELGLLLRRAQASSSHLARRVHPDLDPSAYPLLARLAQTPLVRASDLAQHFGIGRGTMSRQLGRLEALGLLQRHTDPDDSRGQLLELTEAGATRVAAARAARREFLRSALDTWPEHDLSHLAAWLERLNRDLGDAAR